MYLIEYFVGIKPGCIMISIEPSTNNLQACGRGGYLYGRDIKVSYSTDVIGTTMRVRPAGQYFLYRVFIGTGLLRTI